MAIGYCAISKESVGVLHKRRGVGTMNRSGRAKAAQETLDIFEKGYYFSNSNKIVSQSIYSTEFLLEKELEALAVSEGKLSPTYEVVNESVIDTILRFGSGNSGVLNFASAKNPGGGFLNGSLAQEEALAVSSDLYNSQLQAQQFYDINRGCRTTLYTHNMIYSREITFIRDGSMNLLDSPILVNVLTSPAVNAGAYYKNENGNKSTVLSVMEKRIRYILKVFADKGDRTIILGAFGCGVFKNDANDVASIFYKLLKSEHLENNFERIVFAVYDQKGQQYDIFKQHFVG